MASKLKCNPFELVAFEAAVSMHPGSEAAQGALQDYLEENGYSNIGARQRVARVVREAVEHAQCERVKQILAADHDLKCLVIHRLCSNGRYPRNPLPTLNVFPRFQPTTFTNVPGYWRDQDGNRFGTNPNPRWGDFATTWIPATAYIDISAANVAHLIEVLTATRQDV